MERADTLAYATWVGSPDFFNEEVGSRLAQLLPEQMQAVGQRLLVHDEALTLQYANNCEGLIANC